MRDGISVSHGRILVVAPHHDDEAIGCGGLLAKESNDGVPLSAVYLFAPLEGVQSPAGVRRREEAACAALLLGITDTFSLDFECRAPISVETIAWRLVKVFRDVRPTTVLVPHAQERDPEHRVAREAVLEAAWLSASAFRADLGPPAPPIETILGYEVWTPIARPQLLVDISDVMPKKMSAVGAYASQLELVAYGDASAGLARYRGAMMANCTFAEAFTVERTSLATRAP